MIVLLFEFAHSRVFQFGWFNFYVVACIQARLVLQCFEYKIFSLFGVLLSITNQ